MNTSDEKLVTAFVDGELAGEELDAFAARLENEPDLRKAVEAAAGDFEIADEIREVFAGGDVIAHDLNLVEIPNAEKFNASIQDRIAE